jgi:hypothetical protein
MCSRDTGYTGIVDRLNFDRPPVRSTAFVFVYSQSWVLLCDSVSLSQVNLVVSASDEN